MRFSAALRATLAVSILLGTLTQSSGAPQVSRTRADASLPPRGFGSVGFEIRNSSSGEGEFQLEAEVTPPLQLTGAAKRTLQVPSGATGNIVFNLYAPVGTREGGSLKLKVTDLRTGEIAHASHSFGITPQPALESRALTTKGDPASVLRSRGSASSLWELALFNKGNTPLEVAIEANCSPASATLTGLPSSVALAPGESRRLPAILQNRSDSFTEAVARIRVQGSHEGKPLEATHHFVRLENYPDPKPVNPAELYEQLRSTAGFVAGFINDEPFMLQFLETEGWVAPQTMLRFQGQLSNFNDTTSSVSAPGYDNVSRMRFSLEAPNWSVEAGEVGHDFGRLLTSAERGTGMRASVAVTPQFRFTAFAAESNHGFSDKQTGGVTATLTPAPAQTVELQALTVRNDPNPLNERWSAGAARWIYTPSKNLALELEGAYGGGANTQGGAIGATFLWRGTPWNMPAELRLDGGMGDKDFTGNQQGRQDGRISLSLQPAKNLRLNGLYYRSHYESEPFFEETIEDLQSIAPDFTRRVTSSATHLSASWSKPFPMTLAYQENSSFQRSEFSESSTERTLRLTASHRTPKFAATATLTGGTEDRHGADPTTSQFVSFELDTSFPVKTSRGLLTLNSSGRYTQNLGEDERAVNRTGLWLSAGATFVPDRQTALAAQWRVEAYGYEQGTRAIRTRGGIQYQLTPRHTIGLEGAYTLQQSDRFQRQETAILFTYRYSFGTPLNWRPIRGSMQGTIYNDLNVNGRQDSGEEGVPDVAIRAGSHRALTGPKGEFHLPAMEPGKTSLEFSDADGAPLHFSTPLPENTMIQPGKIGEMAMGIVVPQRMDGVIQAAEGIKDSFGILAQQEGGEKIARSFTRGDGSFSIYLEPGTYRITPEGVHPPLEVSPKEITVTVAPGADLPSARFEVKEKAREIKRKVFQQL